MHYALHISTKIRIYTFVFHTCAWKNKKLCVFILLNYLYKRQLMKRLIHHINAYNYYYDYFNK